MEKKDFFQMVQMDVKKRLGEEYRVSLKEIIKNNHVILNGLVIVKENINICPTIYIDSFWQSYRWGMSVNAITDKILEVYFRESPKESVDMEFFKDFELVREQICFKLINFEENQELLGSLPHIKYLDMAICFYYAYRGEEIGRGTILIHQNHVEMWNTNTKELMRLALINTPRIFPMEFRSMEEILMEISSKERDEWEEADGWEEAEKIGGKAEIPMYVVTNSSKIFGAAVILYEGLLKEISDKIGSDLLIIPSSIHEVILLKDDGSTGKTQIKKMIHEVNETQVEPEERLSESLYRYDRKTEKTVVCG